MITRDVLTEAYATNAGAVQQAEALLLEFEQSIAPGAWPFLDKATIISELRARIHNPFLVSQGGQPFCGPASVLFELVRKQPQRYIEICRSLFLVGGFHSVSQYIASSEPLRHSSFGNLRMGQADWMVLATLRDVETRLFPVEPNAPNVIRNLAGMTKSWEMKGWIREILGYTNIQYCQAYLTNDLEALNAAAVTIQAGGVAFALITAEGMLSDKPPLVPFPSHWIALLGNVVIQAEAIEFDIYTWSKQMRLKMELGEFKKYFWATITAL